MKLKLKNIGRIREAEIQIDGISVICGDNDTGKSTVGKILYSTFAAFHDLEKNIRRERIDSISRSIRARNIPYRRNDEVAEKYFGELVDVDNPTESQIRSVISAVREKNMDESKIESTTELVERVQDILKISDDEIATAFLQRVLSAEFGKNWVRVNAGIDQAKASLEIKGEEISFHTVGSRKKLRLDKYYSLEKQLIYIDDPFVLDELNHVVFNGGHRSELAFLIRRSLNRNPENVIEEIMRDQKLQEVLNLMNHVSEGELIRENGEIAYHHAGLSENLDLGSISTGLKTFAILRTLLTSGYLEEDGIIVLDEPEVHLHPEWQIKLAEIIVLLQKAFSLNVLITTHSNDFLSAIDHYTKMHEIRNNCHFYLTETEQEDELDSLPGVTFIDMTDDMEKVYASISDPFLKLYSEMDGD